MKTAERQFTVKIQRYEQMLFAGPFYSRSVCHVTRLPNTSIKKKP